jgi:hypothetical protein
MKYNLVAQMKYCIFQKLAQMQYAQITNVVWYRLYYAFLVPYSTELFYQEELLGH